MKRHSPRCPHTPPTWPLEAPALETRSQSLSTRPVSLFTAPHPEHPWPPWPPCLDQDEQCCSHFPDDIIPAGAKSLFGGVFFHSLLFFPLLRPRNQSKPRLLPQHVNRLQRHMLPSRPGHCNSVWEGKAFYPNKNTFHLELKPSALPGQRTLSLLLPLASLGVFLALGPGFEAP